MSVSEILLNKLFDWLGSSIKKRSEDQKIMDDIAFKISESKPLSAEQRQYLKLSIPEDVRSTFWEIVKDSDSKQQFIIKYKQWRDMR